MAETTLNLEYTALQESVSHLLGWDFLTLSNQGTREAHQFAKVMEKGLNRFFYAGGTAEEPGHEWSFLRKVGTISVTSGTQTYNLNDDYSGILLDDSITFASGSGNPSLSRISEHEIRNLAATETTTGIPLYYAIRPKTTQSATDGFRYEIMTYPIATASHTLSYSYKALPTIPTAAGEYVAAPAAYTSAVLEAILAAAELIVDDEPEGMHEIAFRSAIQNAVRLDRQVKVADSKGMRTSFPTENLEDDSLRVTYFTLLRRVGQELGYGFNYNTWGDAKLRFCDQVIESAYRNVLHPDPIDASAVSHQWSFLRPLGELKTVTDQRDYLLPPEFESFHGTLTMGVDGSNNTYPEIKEVPVNYIRQMRFQQDYTGYPEFVAVVSVSSSGVTDQRQKAIFHPRPDREYIIEFEFEAIQHKLSKTYPFPVGGVAFGELILAACLAESEAQSTKSEGIQARRYMKRLVAAISTDYRRDGRFQGHNGSGRFRSRGAARRADRIYSGLVTYNGSN